MVTDKDILEYKTLCSTLGALEEKYLKRKEELRRLLEETFALKKRAFTELAKANRFTRHLTGRQRQTAGLYYRTGEIKARINRVGKEHPGLPAFFGSADAAEKGRVFSVIEPGYPSLRELKRKCLAVLAMIDRIRKNLLQFDLLEMRCRELLLSINKALAAFRHESALIRRKIYPLGVFSLLRRSLRSLAGGVYFSPRDMEELGALGNLTGDVLKLADSPII